MSPVYCVYYIDEVTDHARQRGGHLSAHLLENALKFVTNYEDTRSEEGYLLFFEMMNVFYIVQRAAFLFSSI